MKKTKIRERKSHVNGTRFKVGNKRYLVRAWCGNKYYSLSSYFEDINPFRSYDIPSVYVASPALFYYLIFTLLPRKFRKESPCSSLIRIHNRSANYSYDIMIEPNRIICFPKPVGYVINLKRRNA